MCCSAGRDCLRDWRFFEHAGQGPGPKLLFQAICSLEERAANGSHKWNASWKSLVPGGWHMISSGKTFWKGQDNGTLHLSPAVPRGKDGQPRGGKELTQGDKNVNLDGGEVATRLCKHPQTHQTSHLKQEILFYVNHPMVLMLKVKRLCLTCSQANKPWKEPMPAAETQKKH